METWALTFFGVHRTVRPSTKRLVAGYVSVLLVAGGIIGELGVGIQVATIDGQLQGLDIQLRIKNAELRSDSDQLLALVRKEASDADERASANEKEAAQLQKEAEDERMARVKIEGRVTWRRLTASEQGQIAEALKPLSAGQRALVMFDIADLEGSDFAIDIATALHLADWQTFDPLGMIEGHEGPVPFGTNSPLLDSGVEVFCTPDKQSEDAADAVVRELNNRGFDSYKSKLRAGLPPPLMPRTPDLNAPPPTVSIYVHTRPNGPQGEFKLQEAKNKAKK